MDIGRDLDSYLAGLFDGEGSIPFYNTVGKDGSKRTQIRVEDPRNA